MMVSRSSCASGRRRPARVSITRPCSRLQPTSARLSGSRPCASGASAARSSTEDGPWGRRHAVDAESQIRRQHEHRVVDLRIRVREVEVGPHHRRPGALGTGDGVRVGLGQVGGQVGEGPHRDGGQHLLLVGEVPVELGELQVGALGQPAGADGGPPFGFGEPAGHRDDGVTYGLVGVRFGRFGHLPDRSDP